MLLPPVDRDSLESAREFDIWITPSLGDIADTEKFKAELALVVMAFEIIGAATDSFASVKSCRPEAIAETLARILSKKPAKDREQLLQALASTLFAVTGKSDNNFKCQFPLYLRDQSRWTSLPLPSGRSSKAAITSRPIPRTIKSDTYMSLVARVQQPGVEAKLLREFLSFVLNDESAINQFWSVGYSYFALKPLKKSEHLLAPIVIFKVRGSVMASGGHEPESLLRGLMSDWGLRESVDFNQTDVVVIPAEANPKQKTRAYDFVLPFRTEGWAEGWDKRVFIQCQFYAGDSGSVSHKNVDQTKSSRDYVSAFVRDPCFVEYVDGAGYFSSLNGDLRRLLAYPDTHGFFQVRSAAVRLRYHLQQIGFLTPLEVEHAIAQGRNRENDIRKGLLRDGYEDAEISRCLRSCEQTQTVLRCGDSYRIHPERETTVRMYMLLDLIARKGDVLDATVLSGKVLIPGYGPFYGIPLDDLAKVAMAESPVFRDQYAHSPTLLSDVRRLSERGFVMAR